MFVHIVCPRPCLSSLKVVSLVSSTMQAHSGTAPNGEAPVWLLTLLSSSRNIFHWVGSPQGWGELCIHGQVLSLGAQNPGIFYPRDPESTSIAHMCLFPGSILTRVDDAIKVSTSSPGERSWRGWWLGWMSCTCKPEHPHACVQGRRCRTELRWEKRVPGHSQGPGPAIIALTVTFGHRTLSSKNSKLKPGFPGHLESDFFKVE